MIEADVTFALQLQQAGRFADAARSYHAILARRQNDADALHLYGVLHFQNGYFDKAVELIGRAVALRPNAAAFHANLAEAYRALGRHEKAVECCQTALRLQSIYPEAANNLGLALHDLGRFDEAVALFRNAIEMRRDFAVAQNNLGTSLRELGQFGQAMAAYRAAVELDPKLALARSNLGQLLVDHGQPEEGLTHCQESVRLQPNVPAALNNLGNAYRALERWAEAHAAYDHAQAVAEGETKTAGELPQILANRGLAVSLEGNRDEAFALFRRAIDLAPNDVAMRRYLGNALEAYDDHAAALTCWREIVEMTPHDAGAHNAMGWSLQQEGRLAEAATSFTRALELAPRHLDALLNRGALHEELGEMADAEAWYRKAQTFYPHAPSPLARLAQLLRGKLPDADRDAIVAQLGPAPEVSGGRLSSAAAADEDVRPPGNASQMATSELPPKSPARGALLFGLAQLLDARHDSTQAAACLEQANAFACEERRRAGKRYDPASHSALVDRLIAGFTPQLFDRLAAANDDTQLPVFVFGMPRSGTTLVEQVLASHSRVHGAGELSVTRELFESIPALLGLPDEMRACLAALDLTTVHQLRQRHLERLHVLLKAGESILDAGVSPIAGEAPRSHSDRIVDKMPDNYLYLGLLAVLFPRATFIHVRRDLRDVATSCWMTNFRNIRWADAPENLAARCRDHRRLMDHWRSVLPVPVHEVHYEKLVEDFDTEAPRLVKACGLEWEPACASFHQTSRPVKTASITQVRQPLYRKAVARWKHYEQPLAELFARLPVSDD